MQLAVDTGGTFTDLVVRDDAGQLSLYKSPTTPSDPVQGVLNVLETAARSMDLDRRDLLAQVDLFIYGTTLAINAILVGNTAKTAFLTTEGHPDILLFREGGRTEAFNYTRPYPEPYVPRSLTYQIPERIDSTGAVVKPLDEDAVVEIAQTLSEQQVEAVAVCLLWSIMNPVHEERVGELLQEHLPGIPVTLSHRLNPTIREYRRASSAAMDASLKPLMAAHLASLASRIQDAGFNGRFLMVSSSGGVLEASAVAEAPIHSINSGPAMAPVAGLRYAQLDDPAVNVIVADTGGTSYDVSLVRDGRILSTRETWLGPPYFGHITGFPSVGVKSIGAGGGSIAWVDRGGLLHVGPQSAGSQPGPVCYGRGGTRPTVTDAALALGYLDPEYFLGGSIRLDTEAAIAAIEREVGARLGLDVHETALAILRLATEHMVGAIEDITLNQGIDPRTAVLVGGGGAAGLNSVAIARRLGCRNVLIPEVGAALSAAGGLISDLAADYARTFFTTSSNFDFDTANTILAELGMRCQAFIEGPGSGSAGSWVEFSVEARYPHQVWEIEVPLRSSQLRSAEDVEQLRQDFHARHQEIFAISDTESPIEIVAWRAHVRCRLPHSETSGRAGTSGAARVHGTRQAYFPGIGSVETRVCGFESMEHGARLEGPVIVESPVTTVVVDPGASVERTRSGSLLITTREEGGTPLASEATAEGGRRHAEIR